MTGRRTAASAVALAALLLLTACTGGNDGLVEQYQQGGDKGYISGDGTVQEIAPADRGDAVAFTGTAVDGSTVTSTDYADHDLPWDPVYDETVEHSAPL